MNKTLAILIMVIYLSACGSNKETPPKLTGEVTLNSVLTALNKAGIQYIERAENENIYDIQREGSDRHLYNIEQGKLTIYIFSSITQRRKIQRDPFPTAKAVPPNGSYGMGSILVFYYNGDTTTSQKLVEAFESFGVDVEEKS